MAMAKKAGAARLDQGEVAPVYLFWGEEKYLLNEAIGELKKKILPPGLEDFNFDLLVGEKLSPKAVVDAANALPFMAEKRLVLVDNPAFLTAAKDGSKGEDEALVAYLDDPNPQCCLLIKCTDKIDKRKKLFKQLQQKAVVIEFAPLKGAQLEGWISDYLSAEDKQIERQGLAYISAMSSFTLEMLKNELEKLIAYAGDEKRITLAMVETILSRTIEANIFDLIDAIATQKGRAALGLLDGIMTMGEAPLKILALLTRHFRLLILMKDLKQKGCSENEIKDKLKLHPFVVKKGLRQGAGFKMEQLYDFLEQLLLCEVELKSSSSDGKRLLEGLIINFCSAVGR